MIDRPKWCPHQDCKHLGNFQNKMCAGRLTKPMKHDNDFNTHRFCLDTRETEDGIFDLQINKGDCWWFELLFKGIKEDAIEIYPPEGHFIKNVIKNE